VFDNSKKTKVLKAGGKRALKSLSDMIKGKQGVSGRTFLERESTIQAVRLSLSAQTSISTSAVSPKWMALNSSNLLYSTKLEEKGYATTSSRQRSLSKRRNPKSGCAPKR